MCEVVDRYKELRKEFFGLDRDTRLGPKGIIFKLSYLRCGSPIKCAFNLLSNQTSDPKADLPLLQITMNDYFEVMEKDLSGLVNACV